MFFREILLKIRNVILCLKIYTAGLNFERRQNTYANVFWAVFVNMMLTFLEHHRYINNNENLTKTIQLKVVRMFYR